MAKYTNKQHKQTPYDKHPQQAQSTGFFSKIKSFFGTKEEPVKTRTTIQPDLDTIYDDVEADITSRNPNDTLADFFLRKGDTPLNDIEIEGVMSLIKKAHSGNTANNSRNTSVLFNQSRSGFFGGNTSRVVSSKNHSLLHNDSQMNNTTVLRRASNVSVNIPVARYNPPGSSTNSANTSIVDKSMLSAIIKKRRLVSNGYNVSKLDDRRKVSTPLATYIEKKKRESKLKDQDTLIKVQESVATPNRSNLSKTANTLLDILDSKNENKEKEIQQEKKRNDIIVIDEIEPKSTGKDIFNSVPESATDTAASVYIQEEKSVADAGEKQDLEVENDIIIIGDEEEDEEEQEQEAEEEMKEHEETQKVEVPQKIKPQQFTFANNEKAKKIESVSTEPVKPTSLLDNNENSVSKPVFAFRPVEPLFSSATNVKDGEEVKPIVVTQAASKSTKITEPVKPMFNFKPVTPTVKPDETKCEQHSSQLNHVNMKLSVDIQQNEEPAKEIIDHFDFPDVSDSNIQIGDDNDNDVRGNESTVYAFPIVQPANADLMRKIDEKLVQSYSHSFTF